MTEENIDQIEVLTRGQNTNDSWYQFRKYVITASKSHNIVAKMKKINFGGNSAQINMWSLFQNISGLTFVNPNIPSLKYGTCMEVNASNTFDDLMKKYHRNLKLVEFGLFLDKTLPFIGASPDRIATCLCCPPSCLEIKCPYSINHLSPLDPNAKLSYLIREDDHVKLNRNHKYYTQCQVQMGVTGLKKCHFFVWTSHGHFLEVIEFDPLFWEEKKMLFKTFYTEYYLKSFFI